jgi:hypothetical protein
MMISLASPYFLFALAALAIPVIIHLFNFRRYRKIYFTNVRFIAEIKQESKKRSQLKHLLILLMRLLAIASLVIAFAQPFLPSPLRKKHSTGKQAVSIYIDNSFSMEGLSSGGRLLDVAKNKALEIAGAFNPSDRFQLLTNDFEGRHQRFVSREEFRTWVDEVRISPAIRAIPDVIRMQDGLLEEYGEKNRSAYLISDFQSSSSPLLSIRSDTSVSYFFIPVKPQKLSNLYIDSVWFDSPVQQASQPVKLNVRIENCSDEMLEKLPVKLTINKIQKSVASFSVPPRGGTTVIIPFTNNEQGIQYGMLEITDYPIIWDDKFYFAYTIAPAIPVLCINGDRENPYLNTLFRNDTAFRFTNSPEKQLDYSSFPHYPLIILNGIDTYSSGLIQEISRYVRSGGNTLIIPSATTDLQSYGVFLTSLGLSPFMGIDTARQRISDVNTESRLYSDVFEKNSAGRIQLPSNVDLPLVYKYYRREKMSRSGQEDLLKMQNGQSFLDVTGVDKGSVYVMAVPLDDRFSNFPANHLFVPTLYKIGLLSQPFSPLWYNLDDIAGIPFTADSLNGKEVYKIRKLDSDFEIIPELHTTGRETMLFIHNQLQEAGHYYISADHSVLSGLAFNYNRAESDLESLSPDILEKQLKQAKIRYFAVLKEKKTPLAKQIHEMTQGTPLWKYFIILTLLFIAGEIFLVRFMKE